MVKLDIGTGRKTKRKDFISVDAYATDVDIKADCANIGIKENTVKHIHTSHMVEHLSPKHFNKALRYWHSILKNKGLLEIRCPNALTYVQEWLESVAKHDWEDLQIWGTRNLVGWEGIHSGMLNRHLLTKPYLEWIVKTQGFQILSCEVVMTRVKKETHPEYRKYGDLLLFAIKVNYE